jgi:hypothetical protein
LVLLCSKKDSSTRFKKKSNLTEDVVENKYYYRKIDLVGELEEKNYATIEKTDFACINNFVLLQQNHRTIIAKSILLETLAGDIVMYYFNKKI